MAMQMTLLQVRRDLRLTDPSDDEHSSHKWMGSVAIHHGGRSHSAMWSVDRERVTVASAEYGIRSAPLGVAGESAWRRLAAVMLRELIEESEHWSGDSTWA